MYFDYFELLSGEPIPVEGIGSFRSPFVRELYPQTGIGHDAYSLYVSFLCWNEEEFYKYGELAKLRGIDRLKATKGLTLYDAITLLKPTREMCAEIFSFFMLETLVWDENDRKYVAILTDDDGQHVSGEINRDNFEKVRSMMLQLNYVNLDKDSTVAHPTSKRSEEMWNKVQNFLKEQNSKEVNDPKEEYKIGNIVSKVCSIHPSYNFTNIGNLTVFQLYDAFFQIGYMRSIALSERIFSNHGGDTFNFNDWLKPILKTHK